MISIPNESLFHRQKIFISHPDEILGKYYPRQYPPEIISLQDSTFLYINHHESHMHAQAVHFDQRSRVLGRYKGKSELGIESVLLDQNYILFAHKKFSNSIGETEFQFMIWDLAAHKTIDTGVKHSIVGASIKLHYFSQSKIICVAEFTTERAIILTYYKMSHFEDQLQLKPLYSNSCQLKRDQFKDQKQEELDLIQIDQVSNFAVRKLKITKNFIEIKLLNFDIENKELIGRHFTFQHGFKMYTSAYLRILKSQKISDTHIFVDLKIQSSLQPKELQRNNLFNNPEPSQFKFCDLFKQKSFLIKLVENDVQANEFILSQPFYNVQFVNKPSELSRNALGMPRNNNIIIPLNCLKYFVKLPLFFLYFNSETHQCTIIQKIQQVGSLQAEPSINQFAYAKWNKSTTPYNGQLELTKITVKSIFDPKWVYAAFLVEQTIGQQCDSDLIDQIVQLL